MKLEWNNVRTRIAEILTYARQGSDASAALTLAVLGLARRHPFSGPDWVSRLGRSFYPTMRIRPRRFGGQPVLLDPADLSHAIIAEEFLLDKLYDLDRVEFQPSLILDCGAHIGMFTCLAAARYSEAEMVAFEPVPKNMRFLKAQLPFRNGHAVVVEAAVSDHDGSMFFVDDTSFGGRLTYDAADPTGTYEVEVVDLRRFINARGATDNLLLKMDIEGEEENVLPAIVDVLPSTCAIFIEVHDGRASWNRVTEWLEPRGFITFLDRERGPYIDGFARRCPQDTVR